MTSGSEPLRALASALGRQSLGQALRRLSAKEGEVVRLAYVEGRTNKEIAAQLGVSTRTVTRRLRLALQSMENQIGRAGGALSAIALLGFAGLSARFARIGGFLSKSIDGNQLAAATLVGATVVGTVAFVSLAPPLGAEPSFHAWQAGSAPFRALVDAGQPQQALSAGPIEDASTSRSNAPGSTFDEPSPTSAQGQSGSPAVVGGSAHVSGGRGSNNGCDGNPTSAAPAVPVGPRAGHPTSAPVTHPTAGGCKP